MKYNHLTRRDALIALLLTLVTLIGGLGSLDKGHEWGDDFAGYMLHAQTLVNGDFDAMAQRNAVLHPSPRSFEEGVVDDSPLVYVWGLPMALSFVYRLVGYDAPVGDTIIYYKIPGAVFFALFAGVLFLFYRRRFSFAVSLFLAFMLCSHRRVFGDLNNVMTDIPCMAAAMATLLGMELFLSETHAGRRQALGASLGIAMWYTAIVRLNGITVLYCVLLCQALVVLTRREKGKALLAHALPWAVFLALYAVTYWILPQPNSNASDMASVTINRIKDNVLYYYGLMSSFVGDMLPSWVPGRQHLHLAMYPLIALGLLGRGWRREEVHLSILLCGTGAVLLALPYGQDVRYMFNILPLMLMFTAYGAAVLARAIIRMADGGKIRRALAMIVCALMVIVAGLRVCDLGAYAKAWQQAGGRERLYDAYHSASKEMYAYIREHVEEEAVIAYIKPRVLYLNTGRMGMMIGVNGHHFYDADYILTFRGRSDELGAMIWPELDAELTLVYENHEYELYRISDAYRSLRNDE